MRIRFSTFDKYLNSVKHNRLHFFILFLVLPWLVPFLGYMFWQNQYFNDPQVLIGGTLVNFSLCFLAHLINQYFATRVCRKFPDIHQTFLRISLLFLLYTLLNTISLLIVLEVYKSTHFLGFVPDLQRKYLTLFAMTATSLIAAGLTELSYTFTQWRSNQLEVYQLEQQHIQHELDAIKQQVNPHFLFNCLNALSVLISESPETAEKFVDEMSKVYRYGLNINSADGEHNLVTLESEVRYIQSYLYLLDVRYEKRIDTKLDIEDRFLSGQLAPLTLQIIIDHIIQNNRFSSSSPLKIDIRTTKTGQLEVRNTVQKKTVSKQIFPSGLAALSARYKLMFNQSGIIQIRDQADEFSLILPLFYL